MGDRDDSATDEHKIDLRDLYLPVSEKPLRRLPSLLRRALLIVWRAARRQFLISAALQVVAGIGVAGQVLLGRAVLEELLADGGEPSIGEIVPVLLGLAAVTAAVSFANVARAEQQRLLAELVGRYATDQVLEVATVVDLIEFERPAFHDRVMRAATNAAGRPPQMATGLLGMVSAGFTIAGVAVALLVIEPLFLLLMMVAYVPAWLANAKASRVLYRFTVLQTERDRRRSYLFFLLTQRFGAAEVRAFDLPGFLRQRHGRLYRERIDDVRTTVSERLRYGLIGATVSSVLMGASLLLLAWWVTTDRLSLAEAGAAAGALVILGQRLQQLTGSAGSLYESSLFLEDFTSFVAMLPDLEAARPTTPAPGGFQRLTVEGVAFTYPSRDAPSLTDIDLHIDAGEVVALVGENGSGKTTLAKLLAGLYQPSAGAVFWDGHDIAGWDPVSVRDAVAIIFQDFVMYQLPAHENVAAGRHERFKDSDHVVEAATLAGAHQHLISLPHGYDTVLGAQFFGGSDLSIGQWQRVALARAFFRDAPFLILDEPTAALDPRSEAHLFESIRKLYEGRTVLLISHRFSSVRSADRIYVLADGRIVEHGSHADLMAEGGLYSELFTLQAAAYLEPVD